MQNLLAVPDFQYLIFPAFLFAFYFISWLMIGRDPKIGNVAPQYEPPPGVSPGVARYILTGGSDGTTLAAVLTGLAAKNVVSIHPQSGSYAVKRLDSTIPVLPDEAALIRTVFGVEQRVEAYPASNTAIVGTASHLGKDTLAAGNLIFRPQRPQNDDAIFGDDVSESNIGVAVEHETTQCQDAVIDPRALPEIKYHLDALQETFRKNLQGTYFRQNYIFAGIGTAATFAWGLSVAFALEAESSLFITFWLLAFTSIAGMVIGGVWTSSPTHPTARQRVTRVMLPVFFFGLPAAMIYLFFLPDAHGFVLALLLCVVLNNIFFVIMRAPTERGLELLRQLAGFREFLVRVEQDPLDRGQHSGAAGRVDEPLSTLCHCAECSGRMGRQDGIGFF